MKKVLAILCGDLHLSHKPPIGRSAEPNWYAAMERQLAQLRQHQKRYDCPVICAGDVFDKWNAPAELINFALNELPQQFYAIPGQHDLPNHRIEDLSRSAYFTLMQAGKLLDVSGGCGFDDLIVDGYCWGAHLDICKHNARRISLAVVHAYCWFSPATKYPGAPSQSRLSSRLKQLKGYDAVLFGDNHRFWHDPKTSSINCGTFMRRKSDDAEDTYVAALLEDGEVYPLKLDNSQDRWIHQDDGIRSLECSEELQEFIDGLSDLAAGRLDFVELVTRYMNDNIVGDQVKSVLIQALEEGGDGQD